MTGEADPTRKAELRDALRLSLVGATVTVESGPDQGLSAKVGAAGLIVGTGSAADLCLSDPLVSRKHLELRARPDGLLARDLGSLNGTFLEGHRVFELLLTGSEKLTLGETTLGIALVSEGQKLGISPKRRFGRAIGESEAMRHVFELLQKAADSDVTVLLEGESGTGKDVLANALHEESARRDGPLVVVDCGAIAESLIESELFGHEKGAFTGASAARQGAFEQAHGGTLFLDEIGELPLDQQPKLLRALENKSFRRVGGSQRIDVDVRVVAATNRKLREAVRLKEFREDLFYRLAVVQITVPRLAERKDDILPLATHFLRLATGKQDAALPEDLRGLLGAYHWPGNIRELRNVVERFATFERADPSLLFGPMGEPVSRRGGDRFGHLVNLPYHEGKALLLEEFHRHVLPLAVERAGGSVPKAAEALGLPRQSLYRMLNQLRPDAEDG